MARENNGLHAILIILFALTVVLAGTTFYGFSQFGEASESAKEAIAAKKSALQSARSLGEDVAQLKQMLGFATSQTLSEISTVYDADMLKYGGAFPEKLRNYHEVLGFLLQTILDKNGELVDARAELLKIEDKYRMRETSMAPQLTALKATADKAATEKATVRKQAEAERSSNVTSQKRLQNMLTDVQKKRTEETNVLEGEVAVWKNNSKKYQDAFFLKKKALDEKEATTFDVPDGEIRYVSDQNGAVWIDLGRADALSRQTTFNVFPADTTNLAKAEPKGAIEVTHILGDHVAEARVLNDENLSPIMPGDKIYTSVWAPGERKRFALTGMIDTDGDGTNDMLAVQNLIRRSGGIIDAPVNEDGERMGDMSIHTRYLVLGKAPGERELDAALRDDHTKMVIRAAELNIETVSLQDLLRQMGWRNQTPVTRYGKNGDPSVFPTKHIHRNNNQISQTPVSSLFKPRKPSSATRRGGAY